MRAGSSTRPTYRGGPGSLSFTGSQLLIRQDSDTKPTQIVVRDQGTLVLDRTTVTSNYVLRIYLFNDSKLFMYGSTLSSSVILIVDGSSEVYMDGLKVLGRSAGARHFLRELGGL